MDETERTVSDQLNNLGLTMHIVGLKGDRVRLVPPDRTLHLENALVWLNDPQITSTLKINLGISRRQEEQFFEQIETRRGTEFTWAMLDETDNHIGFIGLHEINWRNRWGTGGLFIGERAAWGRGYATDAIRVRTKFAFGELGLHRVEGHTMNPAMKRVYEKCGYKHEGVARQKFWRDGRWHDADLYAILMEDWIATAEAKVSKTID
jgi:RimJ/RimL family protein N-acetyltransferase